KATKKNANSAAPTRRPMPTPSAAAFCLSSAAASWSSSRTTERARSATTFAAPPRPGRSPARMGMPSPVEPLRESDARDERRVEPGPQKLPQHWTPVLAGGIDSETLRDRRPPGDPGARLLELRSKPDQRRLGERTADQLHPDGQTRLGPVERHRHRRLPRHVD